MSRLARSLACWTVLACLFSPVPAHGAQRPLRVLAAASLTEAFTELVRACETAHPGTRVELQFAGSQELARLVEHGGRADVFASADSVWMHWLARRGLLAGEPTMFARNTLVVVLPASDPGRIGELRGLARAGVRLVVASSAVPAGRYTAQLIRRLALEPGFGPAFAEAVRKNVVSEEDDVRGVLAKVYLGEADAGIVYRSDSRSPTARGLRVLEPPAGANVVAEYPIACLRGAVDGAAAFASFVSSNSGRDILVRHGFLPASDGP